MTVRPCLGCGEAFSPAQPQHRYCRRCSWKAEATQSQKAYLAALAELLNIEVPVCRGSIEAARKIDKLLAQAEADPAIRRCATPNCRVLIRGKQSHCPRHQVASAAAPKEPR